MENNSEYGQGNNSGYGPVEPVNVGYFIDKAWKFCWPNVIARAWHYQEVCSENAKLIEDGGKVSMPGADDRWYMDLLSQDPLRTKKALEAEGIVFMASDEADENDWEKWIYTRIIVRAASQSVKVKVKAIDSVSNDVSGYRDNKEDGYARTNPWQEKNSSIGHFLVLTLPTRPNDRKLFAKALSDYKATNKVYPLA